MSLKEFVSFVTRFMASELKATHPPSPQGTTIPDPKVFGIIAPLRQAEMTAKGNLLNMYTDSIYYFF